MSEDMLKLAARCEAATGPDEQLERDIARQLYGAFYEGIPNNVPTQTGYIFPRCTASLDAAMTLVPDRMRYKIERTAEGCNVSIWQFAPLVVWDADAATPALALCAAALRARASQGKD